MTINAAGLTLLQSSEGCCLSAYQDSVGVWTIGYGHTQGVSEGETITQDQADAFLASDADAAETAVLDLVTVPLNENQAAALTDFVFNLGRGALAESTLLTLLNEGQYDTVPDQLMRWVHAGGRVLSGLVTRRQAEGTLWNTPVETADVA